VQCHQFYSHLITHFNKQENDLILPSKCKHCTKCILHVRHMKDHLENDHNNAIKININKSLYNNDKKQPSYARKRKRSAKSDNISENDLNIEDYIEENSDEDDDQNFEVKKKNKSNLKSQNFINNDIDEENSNVDIYDFAKQDSEINHKTNYKGKRRRSSVTVKKSLSTSINPSNIEASKPLTTTTTSEVNDIKSTSTPTIKKQKALKQTNIKKNNQSIRRSSIKSARENIESDFNENSQSQVILTTLVGNLKFSCVRSMFKCIECGGSDVKCHFRY
jgi:hypothetical protein